MFFLVDANIKINVVHSEPYQSHSIPPNWGVHAVTGGPKFQSRHHLGSQRKLRSPKLKYESLEISEVRGPFERKVLMHYSYFGPLWKQSSLLINCCWAPLKRRQATLHITIAKGSPRQVPRLPSLKHTTVYNPDNDLIWEYETDWTRSASSDMRSFLPDVRPVASISQQGGPHF